jgi:glyoxylase-like metal-dependent hydrolase (beta-lactamase superfamily II)
VTGADERYEVYAVKYAERTGRRPDHFLGGDPDDRPMPMDYFVWAIVGTSATWVVDTGFAPLDAEARGRRLLRSAADGLAAIGVDASTTSDVILTHLHYDHAGGLAQFPAARLHVQEREMAFTTGATMLDLSQRHSFTAGHVATMVHAVHDGRVVFHDGDDELAPGLTVHHLGGHTDGMQVVRVRTDSGWLVLASDATHYYENIQSRRPFPIVYDVDAMVAGWDRLTALADPSDAVVPGHDPLVLARYPAVAPEVEGVAVRLDLGPVSGAPG